MDFDLYGLYGNKQLFWSIGMAKGNRISENAVLMTSDGVHVMYKRVPVEGQLTDKGRQKIEPQLMDGAGKKYEKDQVSYFNPVTLDDCLRFVSLYNSLGLQTEAISTYNNSGPNASPDLSPEGYLKNMLIFIDSAYSKMANSSEDMEVLSVNMGLVQKYLELKHGSIGKVIENSKRLKMLEALVVSSKEVGVEIPDNLHKELTELRKVVQAPTPTTQVVSVSVSVPVSVPVADVSETKDTKHEKNEKKGKKHQTADM